MLSRFSTSGEDVCWELHKPLQMIIFHWWTQSNKKDKSRLRDKITDKSAKCPLFLHHPSFAFLTALARDCFCLSAMNTFCAMSNASILDKVRHANNTRRQTNTGSIRRFLRCSVKGSYNLKLQWPKPKARPKANRPQSRGSKRQQKNTAVERRQASLASNKRCSGTRHSSDCCPERNTCQLQRIAMLGQEEGPSSCKPLWKTNTGWGMTGSWKKLPNEWTCTGSKQTNTKQSPAEGVSFQWEGDEVPQAMTTAKTPTPFCIEFQTGR